VGSAGLLAADAAWAQTAANLKPGTMIVLAKLARDIFPHDRVPDRFYVAAVRPYDEKAGPDVELRALLEEGVAKLDAAAAERYGLVNRVVPHDQLLPTAYEWARRLAEGPTLALSMTKRMVNNEWNMDLVSALEAEAQAQALIMMGEDHKAFYEAYRNKERPKFTGR
jgi:hypothetical protein